MKARRSLQGSRRRHSWFIALAGASLGCLATAGGCGGDGGGGSKDAGTGGTSDGSTDAPTGGGGGKGGGLGGGVAGGQGGSAGQAGGQGGSAGQGGSSGGGGAQGGGGAGTGAGGVAGQGTGGQGGSAGQGGGGGAAPGCSVAGSEIRLTNSAGTSQQPRIVRDGDHFVVVWADARGGTATPFGAQLSIAGQKSAAEAPLVATTADARRVSVTATPNGLISTWEEAAGTGGALNLMGLGLGHDLVASGNAAIIHMAKSSESRPQIVNAAGVSTFAWMEAPQGATGPDGGAPDPGISSVARVTDGLMLATNPAPVALSQANATVVYPFLATNGNVPAVAYVATYANHTEVRLALFDADLKIARDVVVRDHQSDASNPSVGWDGTRWAVAWEDLRGGDDESVYASFVSTDGTVVPPFMVAPAGSNWPRIASDGAGLSVITYYLFSGAAQIYVSAYDAQNQRVGDPIQISHSTGSRGAKFPSLAFDSTSGDFGVAWDDLRSSDYEIYYSRVHCVTK